MKDQDLLRMLSLELNNLSEDSEIRDVQILQLQKIIDYQLMLDEVQT